MSSIDDKSFPFGSQVSNPRRQTVAQCEHDWAWECDRMLCAKCGDERPTQETLTYSQSTIVGLEAEVARSTANARDPLGNKEYIAELETKLTEAERALAESQEHNVWLDGELQKAIDLHIEAQDKLAESQAEVERLDHLGPISRRQWIQVLDDPKQSQAEVERLWDIVARRGWSDSPCCICGYNGPGYSNPQVHRCITDRDSRWQERGR